MMGDVDSPEEPPVGPDDGGVAFEHAAGEPDAAGQPAQGKKAEWMHILTRQQSPLGRTHYRDGSYIDIGKIRENFMAANPDYVVQDEQIGIERLSEDGRRACMKIYETKWLGQMSRFHPNLIAGQVRRQHSEKLKRKSGNEKR